MSDPCSSVRSRPSGSSFRFLRRSRRLGPARPVCGFLLPFALVLVSGCATTAGPSAGVLLREPGFEAVLGSGIAVLPVGHLDAVADAGEVTAVLTNHLWFGLLASLPTTPMVEPDLCLQRLNVHGEEGLERFRRFRRRLVRGESPPEEDGVALSRDLLHRYALFTWVDEDEETGMEELSQDYVDAGFASDVRRAVFERVKGHLEGEVVDLWEGQILWRGAVDYATPRLYGEGEGQREELERTRADAADRFSRLLALP